MAGDAHYTSVSLLLHGDGANGSTAVTDSSPSPRVCTANGTAQISTAQSKFGGASISLTDANTSFVSIPNATVLDLASLDFTMECFIRYSSAGASGGAILGRWSLGGTSGADFIIAVIAGKLLFQAGAAASLSDPAALPVGSWAHVAVTRYGNIWTMWKDGASVATQTLAQSVPYTAAQLIRFGVWDDPGSSLNAFLDDVRITKGVARYTAAFTPTTAAFPNHAGEVAGIIYDDTGAPCARTVRIHNRSTGALIASTTSSASTGAYLLAAPTLDEVQRIVLDDSGGTLYNDIIDRVIPA